MSRAILPILLALAPALAACSGSGGDPAAIDRGQVLFESCAACHGLSGSVVVGPPLNGVVGRKVGSISGFQYSDAFRNGGFVWTSEKLAAFLQNPDSIPGSNMVVTPMTEQDAKDLVAFLESKG